MTDPRANAVVRFDLAGNYLGTWSEPAGPIGIAVHPDGRIFVSRRDDAQVAVYDPSFTFLRFLDPTPFSFVKPTDLAMDPVHGKVYVVDNGADRFYAFDVAESLALVVGVRGSHSSEFKYPSAIAVDTANNRIVVADQDNYRLQVFTPSGVFVDSFGYRIKYVPGGGSEGWLPRTAGLAIDSVGNIYVTDALMSTVRIFDPLGGELGKVVDYGLDPGDLQTPGDVELDATGRVLVANSNVGSLEIYAPPALRQGMSGVCYRGANEDPHGLLRLLRSVTDVPFAPGGRAGWAAIGTMLREIPGWEPPHMEDDLFCARCHDVDGQPGGHIGLIEGQVNLCLSCHTGAGQAVVSSFRKADAADPFGTNPNAADGRGVSHAWGVPAVNVSADSVGPTPGGEMELHLDAGNIKCSTCHNQHNNEAGFPYLRVGNDGDAMCKECHVPLNEGPGQRGTHPVGFDYPGGVGEFPADVDVAPLYINDDNVECMTCHAPHFANSGGANEGAGDGMLLRTANDATLCQTCHTEHAIHEVGGPWQPTCTDCHDVHDPTSENHSLVASQINGTAITFQDNDIGSDGLHDFIHSNHDPASYDGICEACHTGTAHHRNSSDGDHTHQVNTLCIDCHPHNGGFRPMGGSCVDCHNQIQDNGDGIPPGGRRAVVPDGTNPNDFGNTSHHVEGEVDNGDCLVCHDLSLHQQGRVRLRDPDDPDNPAAVIELIGRPMDDPAEAAAVVPFCLNCHDDDGDVPFSDGQTPPYVDPAYWNNAAHKLGGTTGMPLTCMGDGGNFGCHANGHGSPNIRLLNAASGVSLESFCYNCHTDGVVHNDAISNNRPGGYVSADDIEEAFGKSRHHDLGIAFTMGADTFTLQCTTCHNPHVASGKYWAAESGLTPVTRPDFSDPANNPRAMGTALWGDESGEKMDDFAASGSGTGGWYYSVARGGVVAWDQPAVYQPPKSGSGYEFEFGGDVLPDYTSLCLDCHTYAMPEDSFPVTENPPVNWGQGIGCTDNSVDPPDQRVECGAQHGLGAANRPSYGSDPGTWGSNGNPDPIFLEPGVTRGRGSGHWMRWPYESAQRNAGINFVMSCTDCHEAHGANRGGMIRERFNVTANGDCGTGGNPDPDGENCADGGMPCAMPATITMAVNTPA
ncbi:MAG: hypothetical protein ACYSVY_18905 [Planctomycetota bacterium]